MKPVVINSPSLANSNLLELGSDVDTLYSLGVRWFHIDIMDGHYVPNICMPLRTVADIKGKYPDAVMDVHLMVTDPIAYVPRLKDAGVDYFSFHADSTSFPLRTLDTIKKAGMKGGVVINPGQSTDVIRPYADMLDMVTMMAVEPGFAGQKFMERTVPRILEVAKIRKEMELDFLINVDGAINYPNLIPSIKNGANVIVTGVFTIFKQPDGFDGAVRRFNSEVERGMSKGFAEGAY